MYYLACLVGHSTYYTIKKFSAHRSLILRKTTLDKVINESESSLQPVMRLELDGILVLHNILDADFLSNLRLEEYRDQFLDSL